MVEQPTVAIAPTRSAMIFILVGLLLGLVMSSALVFTQEYLDSSFRTPAEVLSELKIPVLASVPFYASTNGHGNGNGNGNGNGHHGVNGNGNGTGKIAVPAESDSVGLDQ